MQDDSSPVPPPLTEQKKPKKKRRGCAIAAGIFFVFFVLPAMCSTPKEKAEKNATSEQTAAPATTAPAETPAEAPTARPAEQPAVNTHTTAETPAEAAQDASTPAETHETTAEQGEETDAASIWADVEAEYTAAANAPVKPHAGTPRELQSITADELAKLFAPAVEQNSKRVAALKKALKHAEAVTNRKTADKYAEQVADDYEDGLVAANMYGALCSGCITSAAERTGIPRLQIMNAVSSGGALYERMPKELHELDSEAGALSVAWQGELQRILKKGCFGSSALIVAISAAMSDD